MKQKCAKRSGFTLIELSIVLVIIGLIVGSVLVGRDLIAAAQLRSVITQVEKYEAAFNTFKVKYNCVPGDCAKAVSFGLGTSGGVGDNGDGNDEILSEYQMVSIAPVMKETFNAWYHLSKAGMIEGTFTGYDGFPTSGGNFNGDFNGYEPPMKIRSNTFIAAMTATDTRGDRPILVFGNTFLLHGQDTGNPGYAGALTALETFSIDTKLDDGNPVTGNILLSKPYAGPQIGVLGGWDGCVEGSSGTSLYDLKGKYANYAYGFQNTPPNPNQTLCIPAIGKAF